MKKRTTMLPAYTREYIADPEMYRQRYGADNPWVKWAEERGHFTTIAQEKEAEARRAPETYEEWVWRMSNKGDAA